MNEMITIKLKRRPESVTAQEVLQWIEANKPGPDQMGGANYVAAKQWVEQAIREICK